jgi:hypothetical protein
MIIYMVGGDFSGDGSHEIISVWDSEKGAQAEVKRCQAIYDTIEITIECLELNYPAVLPPFTVQGE